MSGGGAKPEIENDVTVIETSSESLQPAAVFHIIKDLVGFVLYMHQQIPACLQDLNTEFETLQDEKLQLESGRETGCLLPRERRQKMMQLRENRHRIRKLQKLMQSIARLENALHLLIAQAPPVETIILALGSSPIRPHCVYELSLTQCNDSITNPAIDFVKSKAAEVLSRKVIRTLISSGAGSNSFPGPWKLFLLVKTSSTLDLPLHFLPNRDFRYGRKIAPFRLQLKSRIQEMSCDNSDFSFNHGDFSRTRDNSATLIWFQCRHIITGLAVTEPVED